MKVQVLFFGATAEETGEREIEFDSVADERLGEEVKAFVVLKKDCELSENDFIEWCKTQFAANKQSLIHI